MAKTNGDSRKDDFSFPVYREPVRTPSQYQDLYRIARAHAARNPSDPFAFGRILAHMKRGIADAAEVMADTRVPPPTESA